MPERPPSERTTERELIDALTRLSELMTRPAYIQNPNWWDVAPPGLKDALSGQGQYTELKLDGSSSNYYNVAFLRATQYPDRLEFRLLVNNQIVWERALFFSEPPRFRRPSADGPAVFVFPDDARAIT
jgi:hypothetical protein